MPVVYDESQWPILMVRMPRESLDASQFAVHLEHLSSYFSRREPFGLIVDVSAAAPLNAEQRRRVAEHVNRHMANSPGLMCATAIVVTSTLQRGIFRAVQWLRNGPYPKECFPTVERAFAWLGPKVLGSPEASHSVSKHVSWPGDAT